MKVVILAGGFGTRISEESQIRPKPMVEIGGKPIIWHIMRIFAHHGLTDFIICCGYKGEMLKRYFLECLTLSGELTVDFERQTTELKPRAFEPWRVTLVDTGEDTMTGGRLRRIRHLVDETFCMTYGDGVADVDIGELVAFHQASGRLATVTSVVPPGRFGTLHLETGTQRVDGFREKSPEDGGLINGGYFVLEPGALDLVEGDGVVWELEPMQRLVAMGQLGAYVHQGYWQSMDSLRDKMVLEEEWKSGRAPWKVWDTTARR